MLPILYQLSNIFTEKRKRRIGHYNICLFQDFNARIGAKISTAIFSISLQRRNCDILLILSNQSFYILQIKSTIFIFITYPINFDLIGFICYFFIPINLQQWQLRSRNRWSSISHSDQFLKTKPFEIKHKKLKKITLIRIITIAKNYFPFKMFFIILKLLFNIYELSIKFIILFFLCLMQIWVFPFLFLHNQKNSCK